MALSHSPNIVLSEYGKIYLIRAYNRALTDDEVLYNFNSTKWRFGV